MYLINKTCLNHLTYYFVKRRSFKEQYYTLIGLMYPTLPMWIFYISVYIRYN